MVMPFRAAGRWLREYVRPLVGFWQLLDRINDLQENVDELKSATRMWHEWLMGQHELLMGQHELLMGRIKSAKSASHELLMQIQGHIEAETARRFDVFRAKAATRSDHIEAETARRFDVFRAEAATRSDAALVALSTEVDRLDSYLVYHAAALREDLTAIHADVGALHKSLPTLAGSSACAYSAPGLDALLITDGCDLVVPTEEAGLLTYILRHGLDSLDPGVRTVLRKHLKLGSVAVDAGANIGIHSINMALAIGPEGRLVCFEPLPHLAKALNHTLRLNGFCDRARVQQVALADTTGETTLYRAAHGPMSSLYALPDGMGIEAMVVPIRYA